jgi:hypothetical protein
MKSAQSFVEYNIKELSPTETTNLPGENHQSRVQSLTRVFWLMAGAVFRADVKKHQDIPDDFLKPFLAKVQEILNVDIRTRNQNGLYPSKHCYIIPYVLRHRLRLPIDFVRTLRTAAGGDETTRVVDIERMLSYLQDKPLEDLQGIQEPSMFWNVLESD